MISLVCQNVQNIKPFQMYLAQKNFSSIFQQKDFFGTKTPGLFLLSLSILSQNLKIINDLIDEKFLGKFANV